MKRAAYHRDYYWRNAETRRATARVVSRNRRERRAIICILNQAIDEARNGL